MNSNEGQRTHEGGFDHKSPRPPVPGEEKSYFMSEDLPSTLPQSIVDCPKSKPLSPCLSPKKNYSFPNDPTTTSSSTTSDDCFRLPSSVSSVRPHQLHPSDGATSGGSPPSCLKWAVSLRALLRDGDGVRLFQQYLNVEGGRHDNDALDFWFACEGLRKQRAPERVAQLVKVIYKKFFVKSALPIPESLRKEIGSNIKSSSCLEPPVTLFDEAQSIIEHLIVNTTYPNFLKSDMYLQYLENAQNSSSSSSTEFNSNEMPTLSSGPDPLPTLHEDMELIMNHPVHINHTSGTVSTGYHTPIPGGARLTKDLLLMSAKSRAIDVRPKLEMFMGMFAPQQHQYNSYAPASRQDSELHSLSSHSDARTDSDAMSLTDSSVDGRSMGRPSRRQAVLEARRVRECAALNRETHMNQLVIPRTVRMDKSHLQPMDKDKFAAILIQKLEAVRRNQDAQELLDRKLKEVKMSESVGSMSDVQTRELKNAIREKLQLEDENDQAILDDHVSLVFPDTPVRSPGSWTPTKARHTSRRRKDATSASTFSGDSGNVHDFADGASDRVGMVKSKSMPDYPDEMVAGGRFVRGAVGRRSAASSSKRTTTMGELTDSGVSVVSDTPPMCAQTAKDSRLLAWLMDTTGRGTSHAHTHSETSASKHRVGNTGSGSVTTHRGTSSVTSPVPVRHNVGRRAGAFVGSPRSSSAERGGAGNLAPAQPFVADPSMPPLPSPNTATQLEEARRRLLEDDVIRARARQRSSSGRHYMEPSSLQSTLRKSAKATRPAIPAMTSEEQTTVVFSFCEEQFPYRTKIPGTAVTLRQFKEYLPKKGNYRYFFKTLCEELDNQVIQEEISNDADILPLLDGKIMAQVKPID